MAGHSHWKQVKQHKGVADAKRAQLFSKLLREVSVTAKENKNPDFNSKLRAAIEKAKSGNVPSDAIQRAIERASSVAETQEELILEAYGPRGIALIIRALSDNKNRTVQEVKTILKQLGAKWAEPGSVLWAFEYDQKQSVWSAKFLQNLNREESNQLNIIVGRLIEYDDIQNVFHNANVSE